MTDEIETKAETLAAQALGREDRQTGAVVPPVLTRPLDLGADIVCHSATKFLNGHSDVIAGALVAGETGAFWERLQMHRKITGPLLGSFEAFLLVRGLRTLHLRVRKQSENALALARFLGSHPGVERVHYPGLPGDPGHDTARRQMQGGFGGMLSFLVPGGRDEAVAALSRARVFKRATSLGGVESLIEHRKTSENELTATPDNLIRLSAGIEDVGDLIADLETMLSGAVRRLSSVTRLLPSDGANKKTGPTFVAR